MIYVVEQLIDGEWTFLRRPNGMPVMFSSQRRGWEELLRLQASAQGRAKFRLTKVRD